MKLKSTVQKTVFVDHILDLNQYMAIETYRKNARESLEGRWYTASCSYVYIPNYPCKLGSSLLREDKVAFELLLLIFSSVLRSYLYRAMLLSFVSSWRNVCSKTPWFLLRVSPRIHGDKMRRYAMLKNPCHSS